MEGLLARAGSPVYQSNAQLGALCCNWEIRKYQEVERSHLVTDYKQLIPFKQEFPLSYLVQPLARLKYIKDLVQIHLTFEGIGPKM